MFERDPPGMVAGELQDLEDHMGLENSHHARIRLRSLTQRHLDRNFHRHRRRIMRRTDLSGQPDIGEVAAYRVSPWIERDRMAGERETLTRRPAWRRAGRRRR